MFQLKLVGLLLFLIYGSLCFADEVIEKKNLSEGSNLVRKFGYQRKAKDETQLTLVLRKSDLERKVSMKFGDSELDGRVKFKIQELVGACSEKLYEGKEFSGNILLYFKKSSDESPYLSHLTSSVGIEKLKNCIRIGVEESFPKK